MLAVWVPELPFQLARLRDRGLSGRPLGFRSPAKGRTPTLWMVDRRAKAAGLSAGLPVEVALHRDPGLVILDPAPSSWLDARAFLGHRLLAYSPQGRLGRLGEAFLDLRGTERLHGPALDAAERVRKDLHSSAGWEVHGGLSRSLTVSRLAAQAEDQVRLVADGTEDPFLAPYALKALPALEAKSRERLARFGLYRVGQLQPMEIPALGRLIRPAEAVAALRQAHGQDQEALPLLEVVKASESARWVLNPALPKHEIALAAWLWELAWGWRLDGRFLRRLRLAWWDLDETTHVLDQVVEHQDLWCVVGQIQARFRQEAERRVLIQRLELDAWMTSTQPERPLFTEVPVEKRLALEATALRLHRRFGAGAVRLGT
ncbi:MAG: hypothetical protein JST38_12855 [Bacteroidetes bacterium]|nr:hypothetical protein [Bacteroidota bacterium]